MSATADTVLGDLEQRALSDGVPLDELDSWIAGALGVPIAALYAYQRVTWAAERWQHCQSHRLRDTLRSIADPNAVPR